MLVALLPKPCAPSRTTRQGSAASALHCSLKKKAGKLRVSLLERWNLIRTTLRRPMAWASAFRIKDDWKRQSHFTAGPWSVSRTMQYFAAIVLGLLRNETERHRDCWELASEGM